MSLLEVKHISSEPSDSDMSSSDDSSGKLTPVLRDSSSQSSLPSNEYVTAPEVHDPSAVIGMACRLPGATNPHKLWEVLAEKVDLQQKMPEDRFNVDAFYHPQGANKGTTNARYGYFLEQGLDEFDAQFFSISGKEAEAMDPQQRLLLEVVYEALENAGITMEQVSGSRTSVFAGSFSNDYNSMINKDMMQYPKYSVTGAGNAIISNRISYLYNLHGPSVTIDTACSSSLVCFHMASESLQSGESDIAIVAGSALHFDTNIFTTMTDFGMLSTDGRCRSFDAKGTGYVRGEGVCAIILKRQSAAEAAGDRIRALVKGTGSNHDGLKDGLTLPNDKAQEMLLRDTYKKSGLSTHDTQYFEAHGTGTPVGDPREARAIGAVFAPGRRQSLLLGSIKSNIGHTEGASGTSGILKAVLSLEACKILPNMHFEHPNPQIDFQKNKLEVPTSVMDWPIPENGIYRASVNSFGYGGSNAHVILEKYFPRPRQLIMETMPHEVIPSRPYLIPLTSHSEKAGKLMTDKILDYLATHEQVKAADVAYSLGSRRSMHRYRSFAIGRDRLAISNELANPRPLAKWTKKQDNLSPRLGFIFTGQGAQWHAMGRELIECSSLFRQTLERCDSVLQTLPDAPSWSCTTELLKSAEDSQIGQSVYSQPLCAALQLALVDLLAAWGIRPSAVAGHSSGEIAAAYAAGILSFDNAIICAYYRGLYMSKGIGSDGPRGSMMAVGLNEVEGLAEINAYKGRVSLAAVNSPSSLTLSGDEDAILDMKEQLEERKVFARLLQVQQAFHSHHMAPLAPAFERALLQTPAFKAEKAKVFMFSSVTARNSTHRSMDASYWADNMTGQVRFLDAVTGIALNDNEEQQLDMLLEIGAHPALKGPARETLKSVGIDVPYIGSLDRKVPAFESLLTCAGQLFALGYPLDLEAVNSNHLLASSGKVIKVSTAFERLEDLPTYAWDHGNYWAETRFIREYRQRGNRHTILGAPVPGAPNNHKRWRNYLRQSEIAWLAGHVVDGKMIFPAAGYISMALEAVATATPEFKTMHLRDVMFKAALTISSADEGTEIMLDLMPQVTSSKNSSSLWYRFSIVSFDESGNTVENCHGLISAEQGNPTPVRQLMPNESLIELEKLTTRSQKAGPYYRHLVEAGLQYGENFQLIDGDVNGGNGFSTASMTFKPSTVNNAPSDPCILHPTVLDASFHIIFAAIESKLGRPLDDAFVPTFIRDMKVSGLLNKVKSNSEDQHFWVKSEAKLPGARVAHTSISIQADQSNDVLVELKGFEITALGNDTGADENKRSLFFRLDWQPAFLYLSDSQVFLQKLSLPQIMSLYCHQFPNAKILLVTTCFESTKAVISVLGGRNGERRRFKSIAALTSSPDTQEHISHEMSLYIPELYDSETTELGTIDIVIVTDIKAASSIDILKYIKDGGFVICDGCEMPASKEMTLVFKSGSISVWKKSDISLSMNNLHETLITILVAPRMSSKTETLVRSLKETFLSTKVLSIEELDDSTILTDNIISLVSLDEDIFFELTNKEDTRFEAVQALLATRSTGKNILWITKGSALDTPKPEQAIVNGLIRTARNENEKMRLISLDVPIDFDPHSIGQRFVPRLMSSACTEEELAVRDDMLLLPRMVNDDHLNKKLPNGGHRQPRLEPFKQDRALTLAIGKVGLLDTLQFEDDVAMDLPLGKTDVEVKVNASALNFRDIAASIGLIQDHRLGDECTGIVTKTGCDVPAEDFKKGDSIICWRPGQGAHRSFVRNPASMCIKTGSFAPDIAATTLGVTITAYYSLLDIARLQPGETCLVHAAAGGVGQMAVQIAQMVGARVIATCGAQAKRDYLKTQFGLTDDMIFSSRDSSFVEGVLKVTGGRGCDVALNSLAGDLLHATWACIAPFGRFVEIGKRDIHENTKLDMDPFRKNISYNSVDCITIFEINAPLGHRLIKNSYELLEQGKIFPAGPIERVSYANVQKGFRLLQMGKFFGKVVLIPADNDLVPVVPPIYRQTQLLDASKTYLVVGGLGGLGRSLSEWMLRKGARHLAFLSRSGAARPEAKATVDWLTTRGVKVSIFEVDVTDREQVEKSIQAIGPSLAGVFQAAMILQDTPLAQMTIEQWRSCVYPKTLGTFNLHNATKDLQLDFFVCFSSGSAVIGAMGQGNYAAANAYMDALMRHRRENGLAGFTMNVGRVAGIGVAAEDETLEKIMDRIGYEAISEQELFYQVEEAVTGSKAACSILQSNTWGGKDEHQLISGVNLARNDVFWATRSIFRNLYDNHDFQGQGSKKGATKALSKMLREESNHEKRSELLMKAFIEKIAAVMAVPDESIQSENALSMYGLDSIVAVEFRKWFSKSIGIELVLFDILGAKSIAELVHKATGMIMANRPEVLGGTNASNTTGDAGNITIGANGASQAGFTGTSDLATNERPANVSQSTFQTRMWYLHNTVQDQGTLNFSVTAYVKGEPNASILEKAVLELVNRNEILRTAYCEGDFFAEQIVLDSRDINVPFVDLSTFDDPEAALQSYTKQLTSPAMDIESGEVFRLSSVKLEESKFALVIAVHHIALDNGSSVSFMSQMTQLYDAMARGKSVKSIGSPELSYIDFTLWHQKVLDTPQFINDLQWWKDKFSNAPPSNKLLPFAKASRPTVAGRERAIRRKTLGLPSLKRMKRICARMNVTPFQFLLAAFRSFVFRYTNEEDLTLLMIDGSRPHSAFQDVLGFFVNMVPLRMKSECNIPFHEMLILAKGTALDALKRAQVPFDAIVDAAVPRSQRLSSFPLGQIALNYQIFGNPPKFSTPDFEIYHVHAEDIPSPCDIALEAVEDPNVGLKLRLEYDSYLYGELEMDRFMENFSVFFDNVIKDFRQPVQEVEMCGPKEIQYLRDNCWATSFKPDKWMGQTIWDRVASMASATPEAVAIRHSDGTSTSYSELVLRSQQLSRVLQASDVKSGDFIGILAEPSLDTIATMMAAAQTRCGYVALDPDFADGRLRHMLQDSFVSVLLTSESFAPLANTLIKGLNIKIKSISSVELSNVDFFVTPATASDPFYVIYTSGSTGKPKGIILTHQNTQAMLSSHNALHGVCKDDTILFHSSMSFDLSVAQIWSALSAGATIALAARDVASQPTSLAKFMRQAEVTITYIPATQFALVLEYARNELRNCVKLRQTWFAGEYLPARTVKAIYDLGKPIKVFNQWGPSETTVQTSSHYASYPRSIDINIPIGKPIDNCSHYVVDKNGKPVPASVIGELCVGGAQVGKGYLNRPQATSETFVDDTFASDEFIQQGWTRFYRTGDLGHFLTGGEMAFNGRISGDKQIKLRGYRIDIAEVENELYVALKNIESTRYVEIVVLPRTLAPEVVTDERQLIAFIAISQSQGTPTLAEQEIIVNDIHKAIAVSLNSYMMPGGYCFLDPLPKLISGKVDRQNLLNRPLDLVLPTIKGQEQGDHDLTGQEKQTLIIVMESFKSVLSLPENKSISPRANFFELGGQSILLLRLQGQLRRKLNVRTPLLELFVLPTPIAVTLKIHGKPMPNDQYISGLVPSGGAIDWSVEARLPKDARYEPKASLSSSSVRSVIQNVLVLGVDTFAGVHTLNSLLTILKPGASISVIGSEAQVSANSLGQLFEKYGLFSDGVTIKTLSTSVRYLDGVMSNPHFGLSSVEFIQLGQLIQAIYHVGGHVSLLKTYRDLKSVNIGSVLTAIELSALNTSWKTELHYLSTWSVPHLQSWHTTQRSRTSIDASEGIPDHFMPTSDDSLGYFKGKWVAEMILSDAASRGFIVNIYRSSAIIAGASSPSATSEDNFTQNMIAGILIRGKAPRFDAAFDIDFIPVNYMADALAMLSLSTSIVREAGGRPGYFHLGSTEPLALKDMPTIAARIGKTIEFVDPVEWVSEMREHAVSEIERIEWAVLKEYLDLGHRMFALQNSATILQLKRAGVTSKSPPVDEDMLRLLLTRSAM